MKIINIELEKLAPNRECKNCTACCEGWLTGAAYDYHFFHGKMCHFKGEGCCSIYKNRPVEPCKSYKCEWLVNKNIPEWMKPSTCKIIITKRNIEGIEYFEVVEAGSKIDSTVLNWLFSEHLKGTIPNLSYTIDYGQNFLGSKEFIDKMKKVDNK
jgi:hypothetical protein